MSEKPDSLESISSYLEDEFGMSPDERLEILDIFFEESEGLINQIEEALKNSNCNEIAMHAHAIKGSAANINASHLSSLAFYIEASGKSGNLIDANEKLPLLKNAFLTLQNEYASQK